MSFVSDAKSQLRGLSKGAIDSFGYQTDEKILVIESDDWGSIRVPSAEALAGFLERHPEFEPDHYQLLDTLDTYDDLVKLREVLQSVHNEAWIFPKMTLNFAMANPDFEAIRANGLTSFAYEPIQRSYQRALDEASPSNEESPAGKTTLDALAEPKSHLVFEPQLHGREHLNATKWLAAACADEFARDAFDLGMIGVDAAEYAAMDALNLTNTSIDRVDYLAEATALFEATFGDTSESFIASCYVWDGEIERILEALGITHIQSGRFQRPPRRDGSLAKRLRFMGEKTPRGQVVTVRNCNFETARWAREGLDKRAIIDRGFAEIEAAFANRHPAVVCSHRVNYVGGIDPQNAQFGRDCLAALLARVVDAHPDVRFLTSEGLGRMIGGRD